MAILHVSWCFEPCQPLGIPSGLTLRQKPLEVVKQDTTLHFAKSYETIFLKLLHKIQ